MSKKLMLIDGNSLLFRAFYGTFRGDSTSIMRAKNGAATNAIYALANMLNKVVQDSKPDYALVAFDTGSKTFRHDKYPDYKAGRKETPVDLIAQFPLAEELLECLGFNTYKSDGYEADDIIGSLAKKAQEGGYEVNIYSSDRDLLQLIDKKIVVNLTKKGLSDIKKMDEKELYDELGIAPRQIIDLKGLMGDSSDNIPGIKGVGEKTALKLLKEYDNLDNILNAKIDGKLGEKIKESRDIALESRDLATIYTNMTFPFKMEEIEFRYFECEKLREFYKKYDLNSLLKKLPPQEIVLDFDYEEVEVIPSEIFNTNSAIIMEMMEDNYHIGNIIGIGISNGGMTYFISFENFIKDKSFIKYLGNEKYEKYCYDAKRTIVALNKYGITINNLAFDLPLATYLMEPSLKEDPANIYGYYGKNIEFLSNIYIRKEYDMHSLTKYVCNKAKILYDLVPIVKEKLENLDLNYLFYNVELPLAKILAEMEENGVKIDVEFLKEKSKDVSKKLIKLTEEIYENSGEEFNINSPSQMGDILFDKLGLPKTKKRSTSVDNLLYLKDMHPIIPLIMEYRKYIKLQSVYLQGLQNYVMGDGKIHTIYNNMLTQTGRLSSKYPNLQNITVRNEELKEVRKAFIASKFNNYILSFDYSQIELRVLAHMANSTSLINAFNSDFDIHNTTATQIFNVSPDEVTSKMRRQAKAVNFGIIYGMSDWGLSEELGIDVKYAKDFINKYFSSFPEIQDYLKKAVVDCESCGYVRTILGRYRYIREISDPNYHVREFGKRVAMNTPIQGSAADIIKLAMIKVDESLKKGKYGTKMIMQVHDELVFEVPFEELMQVIPIIEKAMNEAMELKVKLKVEYEYGYNWYS